MRRALSRLFAKRYFRKPQLVTFSLLILLFGLFLTLSLVQRTQDIRQRAQVANRVDITISDFQFSQQTVTIQAGMTVRWTNQSQANTFHTTSSDVIGSSESWDSNLLAKGASFSRTFNTPGTYTYHCNVHTSMTGTIIVLPANTPTLTPSPTPAPTYTPTPTPNPGIPSAVCLGSCPTISVSPTPTPNEPTITPTATPSPSLTPTATLTPTAMIPTTISAAPTLPPCAQEHSVTAHEHRASKKQKNIFELFIEFLLKLIQLLLGGILGQPITPLPTPTPMVHPTGAHPQPTAVYPTNPAPTGPTYPTAYPTNVVYPTTVPSPTPTTVPSNTPTPTPTPYGVTPSPTPPCQPMPNPSTTPGLRSVDSFRYVPGNEPLKTYDLIAKVVGDQWTFNGTVPGPELHATQGDHFRVNLLNQLPEPLVIHWHGIALPVSQDGVSGVTQDAVKPGASFTYDFVLPDSGTYWYHTHQNTSQQLPKGLFGSLIVAPKQEPVTYDHDYSIVYRNTSQTTTKLDALPGQRVRVRLLNARVGLSSGAPLKIAPVGAPFKVVALDGQDINQPQDITGQLLPIGMAQRFDISFIMPASGFQLMDMDNLQTITFGDQPVASIPNLNTQPDFDFTNYGVKIADKRLPRPTFDAEHTLTIGSNFTINGKQAHEIPDVVVKEGQQVLLHYVNNSDMTHPMHLHGHFYSVIRKNGKPVTGSPIHLDSILLGPGETADVAFLADNPGVWMLHCHVLSHAAAGLTMMVRYDDVYTPYTIGGETGNIPE